MDLGNRLQLDRTQLVDRTQLDHLVEAALLGTERSQLPQLPDDSPFRSLMPSMQQDDRQPQDGPERDERQRAFMLLGMAGAIGLYEQVGQLPQRMLDPADGVRTFHSDITNVPSRENEGEDARWSSPSSKSGYYLTAMLDNRYQNLLREYFIALARAGRWVQDEYLASLLDRGAKTPSLRPFILPVIGETGRWLAGQNSAWHYATANGLSWDSLTEQWPQGSTSTRQALLQQARRHDPAIGRQLLESTWKSEPPNSRAWFVRTLATGLSMEDEPFLEAALDDRHHTTRRHAAQVLASLPQSRLCQRMAKSCAGLLGWTPNEEVLLTVSFPKEISAQMVRDGVMMRKGKDISRIRGNQMVDMIGAIPLRHWADSWSAAPQDIVAAIQKSRWPRTLIRAFATAAERQNNSEWARALLQGDAYSDLTLKLIDLLTAAELIEAVEEVEAKAEAKEEKAGIEEQAGNARSSAFCLLLRKNTLLVKLLRRWSKAWPEEVAKIWLRRFAQHLEIYHRMKEEERPKTPDSIVRTQTKQFARSCPIGLTDEVICRLQPHVCDDSLWRASVYEMISILKFRRAMLASVGEVGEEVQG
ncbi:hypothetical protein KFU94_48390 [Chloroflexi bacterium TSY]|nr:hypothetical protein [Chloroflexi bacterium TSY]